jgi:hypothetical protein
MYNRFNVEDKKEIDIPKKVYEPSKLGYAEIIDVIEDILTDVIKKYTLSYLSKKVIYIPYMDKEVQKITKEIIGSFGPDIEYNIKRFYTPEYLYRLISRKVYMFMVEYMKGQKG